MMSSSAKFLSTALQATSATYTTMITTAPVAPTATAVADLDALAALLDGLDLPALTVALLTGLHDPVLPLQADGQVAVADCVVAAGGSVVGARDLEIERHWATLATAAMGRPGLARLANQG